MSDAQEEHDGKVSIGGRNITNMRFADDIDALAEEEQEPDDGSKPEVLSRIAQATAALTKLKPIWRDNNISLGSKVKLMRSLVISIFLYACESWTLTAVREKNAGFGDEMLPEAIEHFI